MRSTCKDTPNSYLGSLVFGGWVLCSGLVTQYSHKTGLHSAQLSNEDNLWFDHVDSCSLFASVVQHNASTCPPEVNISQNRGENLTSAQRTGTSVQWSFLFIPNFDYHSDVQCGPQFFWHLAVWSAHEAWKEDCAKQEIPNQFLLTDPTSCQPAFDLKRSDWTILNRYRTGHGICAASLKFSACMGHTRLPTLCLWQQADNIAYCQRMSADEIPWWASGASLRKRRFNHMAPHSASSAYARRSREDRAMLL